MHFTLALIVSEILKCDMLELENLGQGRGLQHSQGNMINIYKSPSRHLELR